VKGCRSCEVRHSAGVVGLTRHWDLVAPFASDPAASGRAAPDVVHEVLQQQAGPYQAHDVVVHPPQEIPPHVIDGGAPRLGEPRSSLGHGAATGVFSSRTGDHVVPCRNTEGDVTAHKHISFQIRKKPCPTPQWCATSGHEGHEAGGEGAVERVERSDGDEPFRQVSGCRHGSWGARLGEGGGGPASKFDVSDSRPNTFSTTPATNAPFWGIGADPAKTLLAYTI
jgi:hypothetical protein